MVIEREAEQRPRELDDVRREAQEALTSLHGEVTSERTYGKYEKVHPRARAAKSLQFAMDLVRTPSIAEFLRRSGRDRIVLATSGRKLLSLSPDSSEPTSMVCVFFDGSLRVMINGIMEEKIENPNEDTIGRLVEAWGKTHGRKGRTMVRQLANLSKSDIIHRFQEVINVQ